MSIKVKCTICEKVLDIRGIPGHVKFAHPEKFARNSMRDAGTPESTNTETSENANARLAEKDGSIAQLREEVAEKQADLEVSQIRIAELEANLEKVPTSIADFPASEQAAYFTEFLKNLMMEEAAVLAEETGFGKLLVPPAPAPLAETAASLAEGGKSHKIILTLNGKQLGYLKS